ncbi:UbiX family flavin prenyltransferase [Rhizobium sp. A37_96]
MKPARVVVGITGASGAAIAVRIIELLVEAGQVEIHLVVSEAARRTLEHEVGPEALDGILALVSRSHAIGNIGATIASGSFRTAGMIVAPCSMRALAAIATGVADDLLVRAADVHLKERRRLILMTRETPLHLGHLRNMCSATEMGAIIMPPVPAFYRCPTTAAEIVDHLAARAIDLLDLPMERFAGEWGGV